MIFLTVGTQLPFDRLVQALDAWAEAHPDEPVHAQIGPTTLQPKYMRWQAFLKPQQVEAYTRDARLVVAHAGMGTILTSLRFCRPLVLLPRQAALGEHRTDHQAATAHRLKHLPGVRVAWQANELPALLARTPAVGSQSVAEQQLPPFAEPRLIERLRRFIDQP